MGMTAALKARQVVDHVRTVLGIELLCAAQAIDFRRPMRSGPGVEAAHAAVRAVVPFMEEDRELHLDIAAVKSILDGGALLQAVSGAPAQATTPRARCRRRQERRGETPTRA